MILITIPGFKEDAEKAMLHHEMWGFFSSLMVYQVNLHVLTGALWQV